MWGVKFVDRMRQLARRTRETYRHDKGSSAQRLLKGVSAQLHGIADRLERDVEAEAGGQYGRPQGRIEYPLVDVDGSMLETGWMDTDYVSAEDITGTSGYRQLRQRADALGLHAELRAEDPDTDSEERRYRYTVVVRGWRG